MVHVPTLLKVPVKVNMPLGVMTHSGMLSLEQPSNQRNCGSRRARKGRGAWEIFSFKPKWEEIASALERSPTARILEATGFVNSNKEENQRDLWKFDSLGVSSGKATLNGSVVAVILIIFVAIVNISQERTVGVKSQKLELTRIQTIGIYLMQQSTFPTHQIRKLLQNETKP